MGLIEDFAAREVDAGDPDGQQDWIAEDEAKHELIGALRAGVERMRELARSYRYMYPNPGELEIVQLGGERNPALGRNFTVFDRRLERSDMPNPYKDSLADMARIPFRARIVVDGYDEELQGTGGEVERAAGALPPWVNDVDGQGSSFDEWAQRCFEHCLFEGMVFGFVDNDPRVFSDAASRRRAGARPRLTRLHRRDFRRLVYEMRHGVPRLKMIRFVQPVQVSVQVSEYDFRQIKVDARKIVLAGDPDAPKGSDERKVRTFTLFKVGNGDWQEDPTRRNFIIPDDPRDELTEIPLVPHYAIRIGPFRGESPFIDTAWTQAVIWNANSELGNLVREASLTHIHETGVGMVDDPITGQPVLPDTRNARYHTSTDTSASFSIHEMSGSSVKTVMEFIEWKERHIRTSHHRMFAERPSGPVTATEITLEGVHASSFMEMMIIFQEKAWKKELDLMALLGGHKFRGSVSIPHDFGLPSAGIEMMERLFLADKMSPDNFFPELVRAGYPDERKFDLAAELAWQKDQARRRARAEAGVAGEPGEDEEET